MTPGRIPTPRIIVLARNTFESSGLVDGHRTRAILIFLRWVLDRCAQCGETVRLAGSKWGFRLRGREVMKRCFWVNGRRHDCECNEHTQNNNKITSRTTMALKTPIDNGVLTIDFRVLSRKKHSPHADSESQRSTFVL